MKKALFSILALVGMCITFTSCGESALEAKPESTTVGGKWGKAFTIEDKAYPFVVAEEKADGSMSVEMSISLTRIDAPTEVNIADVHTSKGDTNKYKGEVVIEFLDANGNVIEDDDAKSSEVKKLLQAAIGDKVSLTFRISESKEKIQTIKKFRLTTTVEENDKYNPEAAEGEEETESIFD